MYGLWLFQFQQRNHTQKLNTLHFVAVCICNTDKVVPKRCVVMLRNEYYEIKYIMKVILFTLISQTDLELLSPLIVKQPMKQFTLWHLYTTKTFLKQIVTPIATIMCSLYTHAYNYETCSIVILKRLEPEARRYLKKMSKSISQSMESCYNTQKKLR